MTYATIVLNLDAHPRLDERIDFAARLARGFESHLVGLAAAEHGLFGLSVATGFAGVPRLAEAVEDDRAAALARAKYFRDRVGDQRLESFEAVVDEQDEVAALAWRSQCSDLLVLGQADAGWPDGARARSQLEEVLLRSVAPTLVVPCRGDFPEAGSDVLIAWDGSPAAARAVAGAMPMLQHARRVHLLRCDTPADVGRGVDLALLDLPREWLGRHGVRVDTWLEATPDDVGRSLLSRVAGLGANMLVMGAWGHSRWFERVLGGVTQSILTSMTVPVLMSH